MMPKLSGKTVAILATDGFEQSELTAPKACLEEAGATAWVVAPQPGEIRGWERTDWGEVVPVDVELDNARAQDFDALVLPGGQINPDTLRMDERAVAFVRDFYRSGKSVAAICHGPWLLIEAGVVNGVRATSYASLKTDMRNAGAEWVDEEVVVDNGIITSRSPDDLPAFCGKIVEEIAEGRHSRRPAAE